MAPIDARTHLASLAGKTLLAAGDGQPIRILGVTRDLVYVLSNASPLGGQVPIRDVQAAFERLEAGEEVVVSVASLGDHASFVGAAMLSLPRAEQLGEPLRIRMPS